MIDVHFTFTVDVPQLEMIHDTMLSIGAQLMADLQGIRDAIVDLNNSQAAGSDAIAGQLTTIANEIDQLNAETISQDQLDKVEADIRAAAKVAEDQAAQIRANSEQIAGMVPDTPSA